MRIISSDKDYYDFYARDRHLSDQTYVWDRKPRVEAIDFAIPAKIRSERTPLGLRRIIPEFYLEAFCVWFCGEVIPVIHYKLNRDYKGFGRLWEEDKFVFSLDDVPPQIINFKKKAGRSPWYAYSVKSQIEALFRGEVPNEPSWESSIVSGGRVLKKIPAVEMHRAVKSPVFATALTFDAYRGIELAAMDEKLDGPHWETKSRGFVIVNPMLKHIEFWRRIDAFSAFQKLERFVANELAPPDVINVVIPDKLKAQSHGFDDLSFRKAPSK